MYGLQRHILWCLSWCLSILLAEYVHCLRFILLPATQNKNIFVCQIQDNRFIFDMPSIFYKTLLSNIFPIFDAYAKSFKFSMPVCSLIKKESRALQVIRAVQWSNNWPCDNQINLTDNGNTDISTVLYRTYQQCA